MSPSLTPFYLLSASRSLGQRSALTLVPLASSTPQHSLELTSSQLLHPFLGSREATGGWTCWGGGEMNIGQWNQPWVFGRAIQRESADRDLFSLGEENRKEGGYTFKVTKGSENEVS